METKIRYKAMTCRGKIVHFTINTEHPEFEVKQSSLETKVNGKNVKFKFQNTVEEQIMDWLDNQDKTSLMYEKDLQCIIDYNIITKTQKQSEKDKLKLILSRLNLNEKVMIDFMVAFREMKDSIKGLSLENKIKVVFDSLGLAYKSQSASYKHILGVLRNEDTSHKNLLSE